MCNEHAHSITHRNTRGKGVRVVDIANALGFNTNDRASLFDVVQKQVVYLIAKFLCNLLAVQPSVEVVG